MITATTLIPKIPLKKKAGYIFLGGALGCVLYGMKSFISFLSAESLTHIVAVMLSGPVPYLRFLRMLAETIEALTFSAWFSYTAFPILATCLIRLNWRKLERQGLNDEFRLLPHGRYMFVRAMVIPTLLVDTSALATMSAIDFVISVPIVGPRILLLSLIGGLTADDDYAGMSILQMVSIISLVILAMMPLWREIEAPSTRRNIIIAASGFTIAILSYIAEQIFSNTPQAFIQIPVMITLIATILIQARRIAPLHGLDKIK